MSRIKSLTDEECIKLLMYFEGRLPTPYKRQNAIRDKVMILLMLDAGFRVGEVAKTKRGALLFSGTFCDTVVVSADAAKLHIQRNIPTTERLKKALIEMSKAVWEIRFTPADGYAFCSDDWTRHTTVRQIQRIIEHISKQALGHKIHPHMLRHTFATRVMQRTNIRVVQELLGHKSITSTQVYTHPNNQDLHKAIQSLNGDACE